MATSEAGQTYSNHARFYPPELVRRVLTGSLGNATDIKKAVTHWQSDYLRA